MKTKTIVSPKRRGRPEVKVSWPEGEFTVDDIAQSLSQPLTKVSIQLKINKALGIGVLQRTGKQPTKGGRPRLVYRLNFDTDVSTP